MHGTSWSAIEETNRSTAGTRRSTNVRSRARAVDFFYETVVPVRIQSFDSFDMARVSMVWYRVGVFAIVAGNLGLHSVEKRVTREQQGERAASLQH